MGDWKRKTFGESHKGRKVAPMTAAEYAANPALLDNSSDDSVDFHLVKSRGKFMCPFDVTIERRKRSSKKRTKDHKDHIKLLNRMGFVTSWTGT